MPGLVLSRRVIQNAASSHLWMRLASTCVRNHGAFGLGTQNVGLAKGQRIVPVNGSLDMPMERMSLGIYMGRHYTVLHCSTLYIWHVCSQASLVVWGHGAGACRWVLPSQRARYLLCRFERFLFSPEKCNSTLSPWTTKPPHLQACLVCNRRRK